MNRTPLAFPFPVIGALSILTGLGLLLYGCSGDPATTSDEADDRPELALGEAGEYDYDPPDPGSYQLPPMKQAGDGQVLGADGDPESLREILHGQITILSFVYTRCADPTACPMAAGVLQKIQGISREDSSLAENLRLITFSFDPEFDTPELMAQYSRRLGAQRSGSEWMFVTTSSLEVLQPILDAYGQQVNPRKDPDHPLGPFNHMLRVYLIDRNAVIRNIYSAGMLDPRLVIADVRTLLMEEDA